MSVHVLSKKAFFYIDRFLEILIAHNLKCSVKKTHFMENQIRFLGMDISSKGIRVPKQTSRVLDKMENMKLNSPKVIHRFLGYFNYWRHHISNLSARSYHLRNLIRKDVPFKFDEKCRKEQLDLVKALREAEDLAPHQSFRTYFRFG